MDEVDLGPCKSSSSSVWEGAIREAGEKRLVVYSDGSRDGDGRVGAGGMLRETGLATSQFAESLLCGMGRWQGYARHLG